MNLRFLCESVVNNADTVKMHVNTLTGEFIVTYGDKEEALVDADDALNIYMEYLDHAMQTGSIFKD